MLRHDGTEDADEILDHVIEGSSRRPRIADDDPLLATLGDVPMRTEVGQRDAHAARPPAECRPLSRIGVGEGQEQVRSGGDAGRLQ